MLINGISEGDFKTTDDGKKLLGYLQVLAIHRHSLTSIASASCQIAPHPGLSHDIFKIGVPHFLISTCIIQYQELNSLDLIPGSP